jgi:hypothetical protein
MKDNPKEAAKRQEGDAHMPGMLHTRPRQNSGHI